MAELRPLCVDLYGKLAEPCGRSITVGIPAAGCSSDDLRALVAAHDAGLAELLSTNRVRFCINDQVAIGSARILPGDEVALLPPVSGG